MTPGGLAEIWVYLSGTPLIGLTITIAVYLAASAIYRRTGSNPLLNPIPISIAAIVALLLLTRTPYSIYFDGAQFVHFLLGPATVALAVPLYAQYAKLKRLFAPLLVALVVGAVTAALSAMAVAQLLGASRTTVVSIAPKSATTPIAMAIAEGSGGLPSLTAALVVLTGITGGIAARGVLNLVRVRDHGVRGFSVGLAAHGIGTARAFQLSEEAGAFSGLAMGLNGLATALLVPLLLRLFL